ncbi:MULTISPECIES: hypothetical protein [unclassified Sulfitobacter]|uniref:hypothetical protein n=1 Tax=unclassified Sulfitobacter TaxID=196795 RepID=UPI00374562D0
MGLDMGFYRDGEEVFYLRNHDRLFDAFAKGSGGNVYEGYSDFYVTLGTLAVVATMLEKELAASGLTLADALSDIPEELHDLDARAAEWKDLLRYYPAVVTFLANDIVENGPLICSWSA